MKVKITATLVLEVPDEYVDEFIVDECAQMDALTEDQLTSLTCEKLAE